MDEQKRKRRGGSHETRQPSRLPDHLLWLWRHGDTIPRLVTGLAARFEPLAEVGELARAAGLSVAEVEARQRRGNRAYLARVGGEVAAYGWACHGTAECGWRNLALTVPGGDCYLWDFATLPRWRGNGLYPALLTWILCREEPINCYWIMHNRDNEASRRGIARAGFRLVAALCDLPDGRFRIEPLADPTLTQLAAIAFANLLGKPTEENQEAT